MQLKKEIDNLYGMLENMLNVVINNITIALNSVENKNHHDIVNDNIVDGYERLIEEICLDILTKERLYASDLRVISGILKLVSDLERIGDHAEDILTINNKLISITDKRVEGLNEMIEEVIKMTKNSVISLITNNTDLASEVIKRDDLIDKMYLDLLDSISSTNEQNLKYVVYQTLIVKYLERIADHAVNVSEWVVYIKNGFYKDKKIY